MHQWCYLSLHEWQLAVLLTFQCYCVLFLGQCVVLFLLAFKCMASGFIYSLVGWYVKAGIHRATSCRFVACNSNEYGQMFRKPSVNQTITELLPIFIRVACDKSAGSRPVYADL